MAEPVVLSHVDTRGIAHVTLNRPHVNNAYDANLVQSLLDAFAALGSDSRVRLIVLSGKGKHFQAGADLTWLRTVAAQSAEENIAVSMRTAELVRNLNEFAVPTLALVHGACIGGGTGVVAACDVVIASEDAFFAISEVRWGVTANIIVPQLNAAIGARNVRRYALSCERFNAETAKTLGLVHEVCRTGELEAAAAPVIEGLLNAAPEAIAQTKRCTLECAGDLVSDDELLVLAQAHAAKRQSDEAREGLASFVEKRAAAWAT